MSTTTQCTACRCEDEATPIGACLANPCLCHVAHRERIRPLRDLWKTLTYSTIRLLEAPQPATLPSGARLRGVSFPGGVYLARDRMFYDAAGQVLSLGQVLDRTTLPQIQAALVSAATARLALRQGRFRSLEYLVKRLSS